MSRIELHDNVQDMLVKMSEGNPGALTVCLTILEIDPIVDPDSAMSGLMPILRLDDLGIYGSQIWQLYKDICHENIVDMLGVLRANQLGLLSSRALIHAIGNYGEGIDVSGLVAQVKERLPEFGNQQKQSESNT